jgi:hypothetical protein
MWFDSFSPERKTRNQLKCRHWGRFLKNLCPFKIMTVRICFRLTLKNLLNNQFDVWSGFTTNQSIWTNWTVQAQSSCKLKWWSLFCCLDAWRSRRPSTVFPLNPRIVSFTGLTYNYRKSVEFCSSGNSEEQLVLNAMDRLLNEDFVAFWENKLENSLQKGQVSVTLKQFDHKKRWPTILHPTDSARKVTIDEAWPFHSPSSDYCC